MHRGRPLPTDVGSRVTATRRRLSRPSPLKLESAPICAPDLYEQLLRGNPNAGEPRTFVVIDAAQYPKGDLPDSVFGFGAPEPELRLITCGGTFDAATGHYRDNYVVYAQLAPNPTVSGE